MDGWHARLDLEFAERGGRTVLAARRHVGPLVVQRPFYPEGAVCHVYVLHPPGGVVGGDELANRFRLAPGTHTVVTTPAATKFYRSSGRTAQQTQEFHVGDACCEYLPQESIVFAGSRVHLSTLVHLTGMSRFIGWEMTCLGRPASGEAFDRGVLRQTFELWHDGRPLFAGRFAADGTNEAVMQGRWGLGGHPVLGTFLAYPVAADVAETARQSVGKEWNAMAGVTWVDGVLAIRALAMRSHYLRDMFIALWHVLRPQLLGRPAAAPRVWAT